MIEEVHEKFKNNGQITNNGLKRTKTELLNKF